MCGLVKNFLTSNVCTLYLTNELRELYVTLEQAMVCPVTLNERYMFAQQLSSELNQLIIQNKSR